MRESTGDYPLGERPAPSLPVGRLGSLGPHADTADATDILAVFLVCRSRAERNGTEPVKLAREALDRWWEKRRRTNDRETGQNLLSYPWSPGAIALLRERRQRQTPLAGQLRLEHLWPAKAVVTRIHSSVDRIDGDTLARCLHEELGYAVITAVEDAALSAAGVRDAWMADPWDRYRAQRLAPDMRAALDPSRFTVPGN